MGKRDNEAINMREREEEVERGERGRKRERGRQTERGREREAVREIKYVQKEWKKTMKQLA